MIQYKCNKCGRTIGDGFPFDDPVPVVCHNVRGYGSEYDMSTVEIHLCNECADDWIRNTKWIYPVIKEHD